MLKAVQIFVEEDTLEWAAVEAIKRKTSRQKFLTECIEENKKASEKVYSIDLALLTPTQIEELKTNFLQFYKENPQFVSEIKRSEIRDITTKTK